MTTHTTSFRQPEGFSHLCIDKRWVWPVGYEIKVFGKLSDDQLYASNEGPITRIKEIIYDAARTWELYANIKFTFVDEWERADIRVELLVISNSMDIYGHSTIGQACGKLPMHKPTMLFKFGSLVEDVDIRYVALHEWGHSLGMIHEHSSPACPIMWDRRAVLNHCNGDEIKAEVDYFQEDSSPQYSPFDPESIMIYKLPPHLMLHNYIKTNPGSDLSDIDKEWASKIYPKTQSASGTYITSQDGYRKHLQEEEQFIYGNSGKNHSIPKYGYSGKSILFSIFFFSFTSILIYGRFKSRIAR